MSTTETCRPTPLPYRDPTAGLAPGRTAALYTGTKVPRHLRSALVGALLAAALLTALSSYASAGISSARLAAIGQASAAPASPANQAEAPTPQTGWLIEGTATEAPSPLDLPRCTTSPSTPLPCLATISPDSRRAVVLEEDASLTALVRQ